ncbi:MAG: Gfo/Idh/MocA family oxidoreductase [Pseudomonadota bacterium]
MSNSDTPFRIGVLGAGPIAQFGHFEACSKASNAELYAICDVAEDLASRMAVTHGAGNVYTNYDAMLADPKVDGVIVATSDAFHVPATLAALAAGKHVFCEKPLGVSVQEILVLEEAVIASGLVLQVGHMKRFDPGIEAAKAFIDTKMGAMQALKAWYCDSTYRYTNTDAVQPLPIRSANAKKPAGDPKADKESYFMLAHGSHLLDTARHLGGPIVEVRARLSKKFGAYCWFIEVGFESGALGHLDLTVAVRMDWHEGFQIYGEHGAILGKTYNPWYYRSSEVDIFDEETEASTRVLGADGHFFRRQIEGFVCACRGEKTQAAFLEDGIASVRAMAAIRQSVASGKAVEVANAFGSV